MTITGAPGVAGWSAATAWAHRIRKVGGYLQLAFAAFWLVRGGLSIGARSGRH